MSRETGSKTRIIHLSDLCFTARCLAAVIACEVVSLIDVWRVPEFLSVTCDSIFFHSSASKFILSIRFTFTPEEDGDEVDAVATSSSVSISSSPSLSSNFCTASSANRQQFPPGSSRAEYSRYILSRHDSSPMRIVSSCTSLLGRNWPALVVPQIVVHPGQAMPVTQPGRTR